MRVIIAVICLVLTIIKTTRSWQLCCENTECITYDAPYDSWPMPDCPTKVRFIFYSRSNTAGELVNTTTVPAQYSGLRRTFIIAHSSQESSETDYVKKLRDTILQKEDANVILIDWRNEAQAFPSPKVASNARAVGFLTSEVIQNLLSSPNGDPLKFWCIGFSIGAHLCGYTGMAMPGAQRIGRVTGLSPAGKPPYDNIDVKVGINQASAHLVEIYHTDTTCLFGTKRVLGHYDYYFKGHEFSIDLSLKALLNLQIVCGALCQHQRSINFFANSISQHPTCFQTNRHCTSVDDIPESCSADPTCVAYAGYFAQYSCSRTGILLLNVNRTEPYCTV